MILVITLLKIVTCFLTSESNHTVNEFTITPNVDFLVDIDNNITLSCDKSCNYSDYIYNYESVIDTHTIYGVCGDVLLNIHSNYSNVNVNISYFKHCNLSDDIFWDWKYKTLCNVTSNICNDIAINDIFHIHEYTYRVYSINDTILTYEQIAYIQPELWLLFVCMVIILCYGVHSYVTSEQGKIVS